MMEDRAIDQDEDEAFPIYITHYPIRRYEIAPAIVGEATTRVVAPWVAGPYKLCSLADMERFFASNYGSAMGNLSRISAAIDQAVTIEPAWWLTQFDRATENLTHLFLSSPMLDQQARRVRTCLEHEPLDTGRAGILIHELSANIATAMTTPYFLQLSDRARVLYENPEPLGAIVTIAYPECGREIRSAARCLALDEWTASVFHMMRVLEIVLRKLAAEVHVEMTETENWGKILDAITTAVEKIAQEKRTNDLAFYNAAVSQFTYFKDAWRNHVSHTREPYDSLQAWIVWDHLRAYLHHMGTRGKPLLEKHK